MARIRTVKPELFKHEDLFDLEKKTGLPVRIAFIGLFTCCDREGRFKWRPRPLKLDIMPYDDADFARVLDALATGDFVRKYVIEDEEYGVIPTFSKHQVINNRESPSDLPEPTENSYVSTRSTRGRRVEDAPSTRLEQVEGEGKGREGKGREEEKEGDVAPSAQTGDAGQPDKSPIEVVFEHWQAVMDSPRSLLDDVRKKSIKAALKTGYTVEQLCLAIDGCRKSPFHMGENERVTKYNGIDLIFRKAENIDKFIVIAGSPLVVIPDRRAGAADQKFRPNNSNYSSSNAAAARSIAQHGLPASDGDIDFS